MVCLYSMPRLALWLLWGECISGMWNSFCLSVIPVCFCFVFCPGFTCYLFLLTAHMSRALTCSNELQLQKFLNLLNLGLRLQRIKSSLSGVHISENNWLLSVNCCMGGEVKPDTWPMCLDSAQVYLIGQWRLMKESGWLWDGRKKDRKVWHVLQVLKL